MPEVIARPALARSPRGKAFLMLVIGFLAQNVATGLAFGSFGAIILALEGEFGASRQQSSLVISLILLTMSLLSPVVGGLIERYSIRLVMMVGAALGALGYALVSIAPNIFVVMVLYAFCIGPAAAMFGVLVSSTLVTRWFPDDQGKAVGVVNMPIFVMIVPMLCGYFLQHGEIRSLFLILGAAQFLLLPLLLLVQDRPPETLSGAHDNTEVRSRTKVFAWDMLASPAFWLVTVSVGIIVGAGTMKVAHFVPLLMGQGRSYTEANFLFAVSGGAGTVGSIVFGWLADRLGGSRTLIINAITQAAVWGILLLPVGFALLLVDSIVVGACGGGVMAAYSVVLASTMGRERFAQAFGTVSLCTTPFLFLYTPMAGYLYDQAGNYHVPVGAAIASLLVAILCLIALRAYEKRGVGYGDS